METNNIKHWQERIISKLFNEGVYSENYNEAKAIEVLNRCVAPVFLIKIFNQDKEFIINNLISEKEQTF